MLQVAVQRTYGLAIPISVAAVMRPAQVYTTACARAVFHNMPLKNEGCHVCARARWVSCNARRSRADYDGADTTKLEYYDKPYLRDGIMMSG
jgi:hypothetical protein